TQQLPARFVSLNLRRWPGAKRHSESQESRLQLPHAFVQPRCDTIRSTQFSIFRLGWRGPSSRRVAPGVEELSLDMLDLMREFFLRGVSCPRNRKVVESPRRQISSDPASRRLARFAH